MSSHSGPSDLPKGLTWCPLSVLNVIHHSGWDQEFELIDKPLIMRLEKDILDRCDEESASETIADEHKQCFLKYKELAVRARRLADVYGPFVTDWEYECILPLIFDAKRRNERFPPGIRGPVALDEISGEGVKFFACHLCWAVILHGDISRHYVGEHGQCIVCKRDPTDLLHHMRQEHPESSEAIQLVELYLKDWRSTFVACLECRVYNVRGHDDSYCVNCGTNLHDTPVLPEIQCATDAGLLSSPDTKGESFVTTELRCSTPEGPIPERPVPQSLSPYSNRNLMNAENESSDDDIPLAILRGVRKQTATPQSTRPEENRSLTSINNTRPHNVVPSIILQGSHHAKKRKASDDINSDRFVWREPMNHRKHFNSQALDATVCHQRALPLFQDRDISRLAIAESAGPKDRTVCTPTDAFIHRDSAQQISRRKLWFGKPVQRKRWYRQCRAHHAADI